jgi:lysosomal acid lipase/cholesteryl ester hydrolase
MPRLPLVGRIGIWSYIRLVVQIIFAFWVMLTEPIVRLAFYIFPLRRISNLITSLFLEKRTHSSLHHLSPSTAFEDCENSSEFIRYHRFPFESHFAETGDGFILNLHRIPFSRSEHETIRLSFNPDASIRAKKRPVVLLWHGFLMCSEVWLCRKEDEGLSNLPMFLAEMGYDVWLGNTRGNKYSSKHRKFKRDEDRFWNFSIDEITRYDLPDTVDYILKLTGESSLSYIGFSQGSVQGFASLALNPSLKEKVVFILIRDRSTYASDCHP